jgi:short-subunit dehydrogenase
MKKCWQSAWIVGGSTGLGAELVKSLDHDGVITYVSARNTDSLEILCKKLPAAISYPLDITDSEACIRTVANILKINTSLPDLIILNAAVYLPMNVKNFDVKEISNMMNVNYMGVVNMLGALLPHRSANKNVTIAAITSPSGWCGLPGAIGYGPSKAAVINMIESMKPELDGCGFDLRLVNPGFIRTRLTDKNEFNMPQLMKPKDAAARVLKGLSSGKFDISFPNPFLIYMKLLRILPYSLFFWVMKKITSNNKK